MAWAAIFVLFRQFLNPSRPQLCKVNRSPLASVALTIVLFLVVLMWMIGRSLKRMPLNSRSGRSSSGKYWNLKMENGLSLIPSLTHWYACVLIIYPSPPSSRTTDFSPRAPSSLVGIVPLCRFQSSVLPSIALVWKAFRMPVVSEAATPVLPPNRFAHNLSAI